MTGRTTDDTGSETGLGTGTGSGTHPAAPPLRVGLIGYGLAGSVFHAPLIAATEGLALDTVVTSNPERQEQARAEFPDVRVAATPDDLLARADELDLVVIASPNKTHVPLATAALKAGLPVVVDKPVAGTAAEARELAALAEERGLLLSVFQNRRWDNDFLTLRKLLAEGELGDVWRFESRFERWRPLPKGGWRESGDPAEIGGLLYDLGSHLVDQALVLFGPVVSVYAEADVHAARRGDRRRHLHRPDARERGPLPPLRLGDDVPARPAFPGAGLEGGLCEVRPGSAGGGPAGGRTAGRHPRLGHRAAWSCGAASAPGSPR